MNLMRRIKLKRLLVILPTVNDNTPVKFEEEVVTTSSVNGKCYTIVVNIGVVKYFVEIDGVINVKGLLEDLKNNYGKDVK